MVVATMAIGHQARQPHGAQLQRAAIEPRAAGDVDERACDASSRPRAGARQWQCQGLGMLGGRCLAAVLARGRPETLPPRALAGALAGRGALRVAMCICADLENDVGVRLDGQIGFAAMPHDADHPSRAAKRARASRRVLFAPGSGRTIGLPSRDTMECQRRHAHRAMGATCRQRQRGERQLAAGRGTLAGQRLDESSPHCSWQRLSSCRTRRLVRPRWEERADAAAAYADRWQAEAGEEAKRRRKRTSEHAAGIPRQRGQEITNV